MQLIDGSTVRLRPIRRHDGPAWRELRIVNQDFLEPVEPTVDHTWVQAHTPAAWRSMFRFLKQSAEVGQCVPFVIELDGAFVGQLTLGNIQHGVSKDCWIGYWVDHAVTGRGVAKAAVALGVGHAFARVGLHRVTATYLPNNPASGAVLHANGFREEGLLRRNLHIGGQWQDHLYLALLADDFDSSALARLERAGVIAPRA